jgi:diguanylate cyclase (GGDEF)-like protein
MILKKFNLKIFISVILIIAVIGNIFVWGQVLSLRGAYQEQLTEQSNIQSEIDEAVEVRNTTKNTKMIKMSPFLKLATAKLEELNGSTKTSAFIALDGDNFGKMKSAYGDDTVTNIVITLASIIKENFNDKDNDILCNVGDNSDEIYLLITNKDSLDNITDTLNNVMDEFRNTEFTYSGGTVNATFSAGVAVYGKDGTDFESLYEAADDALYQAKENGKNQFVVK